jgi:hypothetical protein
LTPKPEWPLGADAPVRRVITHWREPTVGPQTRVQLARAGKPILFAHLMLLECGHAQLIPSDRVSRIRALFTRRTRCDVCLDELTTWHDDFGVGDPLDELAARRRHLRLVR